MEMNSIQATYVNHLKVPYSVVIKSIGEVAVDNHLTWCGGRGGCYFITIGKTVHVFYPMISVSYTEFNAVRCELCHTSNAQIESDNKMKPYN